MSITTLLSQFGQFLKDNWGKLLLGTLAFGLLLTGWRYYKGTQAVHDNQAAYDHLAHTYSQEPASFQMVFMDPEGDVFTNSFLFDQFFEVDDIREQVEVETGVDIKAVIEAEKALDLVKTSFFRGGLAGIQDSSSGILTFRFLVGESAEENLAVAQAYKDIILDQGLPFTEHLEMFVVTEPVNEDFTHDDKIPAVASPKVLNTYMSPSRKSLIIYGVLGLLLGFVVTTGFLITDGTLMMPIILLRVMGGFLSRSKSKWEPF